MVGPASVETVTRMADYSDVRAQRISAAAGTLVASGLTDMSAACRRAKASVDIATPFLSADVAAYLVRACDEGRATQRRFLTAANVAAIEGGYLDPDGVGEFRSCRL
jgi:hypothetical protein